MLVKVELVQLDTALLATEVKPATTNDLDNHGLSGDDSVGDNSGSSGDDNSNSGGNSSSSGSVCQSKSRRAPQPAQRPWHRLQRGWLRAGEPEVRGCPDRRDRRLDPGPVGQPDTGLDARLSVGKLDDCSTDALGVSGAPFNSGSSVDDHGNDGPGHDVGDDHGGDSSQSGLE